MLINIRKLEGFSYYDTALNDEDIKGICKSGRGNHVNYKYDTLGRVTEKTIDTGIKDLNDLKIINNLYKMHWI
ncbi:RHS repeat family protein [Clostridium botulinum]|uniref:RHS repeat family protein n=1 Tax=Clostridium botulinum TaxID=1491 RepID=A0A9Q1ZD61_CLOBO|nr:hypothetical protein [Clostridium botulinum]AEB75052.1 RHS repeat family [Clostridium botulinum BKT015925]KEI03571.1 hypothetical protein Z953_03695 [Clostridium botulinum D str. 16868]KEI04203.1 hypothetical protein Y848_02475 [Clostridium botulinum C/D str. Sp77]KLU74980.1 RHS repeat family protein [Clostridium botulinum V891]KOA77967.1 RHS repeat family protein [Clostridium botulinum]